MRNNKFDLESELRAGRSQPRADFARALADEVRSSRATTRSPLGRVGLALAFSGLIVVALASFGGIGYASSAASHAVKKPTAKHGARVVNTSAAQAQYAPFTPPTAPTAKPKPPAGGTAGAPFAPPTAPGAAGAAGATNPVTSSQLPFTGLALWMPLAIGLVLIAFGLALRTRDRRRGARAS
jgi:hypothetical protein